MKFFPKSNVHLSQGKQFISEGIKRPYSVVGAIDVYILQLFMGN